MLKVVYKNALAAGAGILAVSAILSETAHAGGFAIREQSAELQGMSFAGGAVGAMGLSSMYFNPATVTQHDGWNSESNISLIIGDSQATDAGFAPGVPVPGANNSGNISDGNLDQWAAVPASYYNYQYNEQIFLGLSINSPFGLETKSKGYVGTPHGRQSKILNIIANPLIGYKFNDVISVAAGPQISYIDGKLTSTLSPFPPGNDVPDVRLKGDDWGFGFTAGVLFNIAEGTQFGVGYRSEVKHKLTGKFKVDPLFINVGASAKVDLPQTLTVSASHQVTDTLKVNASFEWADWSSLKSLTIGGAPGAFGAPTAFNWKDSYFYAIGLEYDYNDALTLRAGFAYEDSPVPDSTRGPRVPDNDRYWLSGGASYKWYDWLTLHGSYTHIFVEDAPVALAGGGGLPPLFATFETDINIVSVSATMNW